MHIRKSADKAGEHFIIADEITSQKLVMTCST